MYEVVQPPQVAVLPVALLPGDVVAQRVALGERRRLAKVNDPDLGVARVVVDEQQGAADDLRRRWWSLLDVFTATCVAVVCFREVKHS